MAKKSKPEAVEKRAPTRRRMKSPPGIAPGNTEDFNTPEMAYAEAERLIAEALRTGATDLRIELPHLRTLPPSVTGLRSLQSLSLSGTGVSDFAPLSGLTALHILSLDNTGVTDLSPLSGLTYLQSLSLSGTAVSSLSELANLTTLLALWLDRTKVGDLSPISSLKSLQSLWLSNTAVSDLAPLAGATGLEILSLNKTDVSNLEPLAELRLLRTLLLYRTRVSDINPIANLTDLNILWLDGTGVESLVALARLSALQELSISSTRVADLSPLAGLTSLIAGFTNHPQIEREHLGLSYLHTIAAEEPPFREFVKLPQPYRTVETINYLRRTQGLTAYRPELPPNPEQNKNLTNSKPPTVPETRPAAIEPVWRDGRLVLPTGALQGNLEKPDLDAALKALKRQLLVLADDLQQEANIDRRTAAHLKKLSDDIPETTPTQHEFFALAHELEFLHGYAKTVTAEWPEFHAARYHALVLSYDRTVKQFPKWNEFKRNASKASLTPEKVAKTSDIARDTVTELRAEDATAFVDATVPDAIENLAKPLEVAPSAYEIVDAIHEELAVDVLEGINNFLKQTASAVLASWEFIERERNSVNELAKGAREAFNKDLVAAGPNAGHAAFKWLRRIAKLGVTKVGIGVSGVIGVLVTAYPEQFSWLVPVFRFFGWL